MKPSTMSLFEREIRDQIAAAHDAVAEAANRQDPLLLQAAESHRDALVALARRNGVLLDDAVPVAPEPTAAGDDTPLAAPSA